MHDARFNIEVHAFTGGGFDAHVAGDRHFTVDTGGLGEVQRVLEAVKDEFAVGAGSVPLANIDLSDLFGAVGGFTEDAAFQRVFVAVIGDF